MTPLSRRGRRQLPQPAVIRLIAMKRSMDRSVARDLLGKRLVSKLEGITISDDALGFFMVRH